MSLENVVNDKIKELETLYYEVYKQEYILLNMKCDVSLDKIKEDSMKIFNYNYVNGKI